MRSLILIGLVCALSNPLRAEVFTVATYNIENFRENFQADTLKKGTTKPADMGLDAEFMRRLQKEDDEDNWEVAQTILHPELNPDVLVIQEGCTQEQLEKFNERWLRGAYETAIVFPSNTGRDQHIGMLLKPGFRVVEKRDQYHLEPDTTDNPRGERLFARGPAFVLVETPGKYKLWIGTNHQKSKSGNNVDITRWRNREAARTNQIINELARSSGTDDVLFLGDMNDEIGYQEFEMEAGGDTMAMLVGSGTNELILATRPLAEGGAISYGGYWDPRRRTFIDHILASPAMKQQLGEVTVFTEGLAPTASDHYPVMVRVTSD